MMITEIVMLHSKLQINKSDADEIKLTKSDVQINLSEIETEELKYKCCFQEYKCSLPN